MRPCETLCLQSLRKLYYFRRKRLYWSVHSFKSCRTWQDAPACSAPWMEASQMRVGALYLRATVTRGHFLRVLK